MAGTCSATRRDGQPCTAPVLRPDTSVCFAHDASLQAERSEARRRGGRAKGNAARLKRVMPANLAPVFDQLAEVLVELHTGELDPRVAQAMASVAKAMVSVLTAGEMEERLRRLEGATDAAGNQTRPA